jgi:hypothetical protein
VAALPRFLEADVVVTNPPAPSPPAYAIPANGTPQPIAARSPGMVAARSPLPERVYQVGQDTEVRTSDNWQLGRVDAIEVAANGRPQTLVVHSPFLRTPHRVPFAAITSGGPKRIAVGITAECFTATTPAATSPGARSTRVMGEAQWSRLPQAQP